MIDNTELPMGFTMHLAQNQKAMAAFSKLTESEQQEVVENARNIRSYEEMKSYVDGGFWKFDRK